jgi:hypothetical protein
MALFTKSRSFEDDFFATPIPGMQAPGLNYATERRHEAERFQNEKRMKLKVRIAKLALASMILFPNGVREPVSNAITRTARVVVEMPGNISDRMKQDDWYKRSGLSVEDETPEAPMRDDASFDTGEGDQPN